MSVPADGNATIEVIQKEPGLVYVKIADPMPRPDRIEHLLCNTIDHWFSAHPQFVIDRSEIVVENATIQGVHIWYHVVDLEVQPSNPQPSEEPTSMTIVVHGAVAQRFPTEYIEAVIDEAKQIFHQLRDRRDTLVVVNPRRIGAILDGRARRVVVIPAEFIEQIVEGSLKTNLQSWLAAPRSRFYSMHIGAS